jgi:hypothetical protein
LTDIVKQLRNAHVYGAFDGRIFIEAADEIVRLRELMSMESGYEIKIPARPAEAGEV